MTLLTFYSMPFCLSNGVAYTAPQRRREGRGLPNWRAKPKPSTYLSCSGRAVATTALTSRKTCRAFHLAFLPAMKGLAAPGFERWFDRLPTVAIGQFSIRVRW